MAQRLATAVCISSQLPTRGTLQYVGINKRLNKKNLTSTIDAEEGRDTDIIDIPNALIQTSLENKEDKVILHIGGKLSKILIMTSPEMYHKYITLNNKGGNVIYVKAINAIYDIMKTERLFYKNNWRSNRHWIQFDLLQTMCCKEANNWQ